MSDLSEIHKHTQNYFWSSSLTTVCKQLIISLSSQRLQDKRWLLQNLQNLHGVISTRVLLIISKGSSI